MNSEQEVEKMIQQKGLTAPRITIQTVEDCIKRVQFHHFAGTTTIVCALELSNGFVVTGESACASPENFNHEIGMKIARENARSKIWVLEGYLLKQRMHETSL